MKRIRSGKGGGETTGGGTAPVAAGDRDIGWISLLEGNDILAPTIQIKGSTGNAASELGSMTATLGTVVEADDTFKIDQLNATLTTSATAGSDAFAFATNLIGIPDASVDQGDATTNFDGSGLTQEPAGALSNAEQRICLYLDMSGWSGFTITEMRLRLTFAATVLADTIDVDAELRSVATAPWTESTVTWNNHASNEGSLIQSVATTLSTNLIVGGDLVTTITWDDAGISALTGNFAFIKIISNADILQLNPITAYSAETGAGSQRPRLEIDAQR